MHSLSLYITISCHSISPSANTLYHHQCSSSSPVDSDGRLDHVGYVLDGRRCVEVLHGLATRITCMQSIRRGMMMIVHVSSLEREAGRICSTMLSQVVVTPRSDALSTSTVGYIQRVFMRLHHYSSINLAIITMSSCVPKGNLKVMSVHALA